MGQIFKCVSCQRHFTDWTKLETHKCPKADHLAEIESSLTFSYGLDPRGPDVLEDDYGEESFA